MEFKFIFKFYLLINSSQVDYGYIDPTQIVSGVIAGTVVAIISKLIDKYFNREN